MSSARKRSAIQKANNEAAMLRHRLVLAEFHAKRMEVFAMTAAQRADAIQAKLDALMLEYCPDEMTPEQLSNWERRQRPVSDEEQANIEAAIMGSNASNEGPALATVPLD